MSDDKQKNGNGGGLLDKLAIELIRKWGTTGVVAWLAMGGMGGKDGVSTQRFDDHKEHQEELNREVQARIALEFKNVHQKLDMLLKNRGLAWQQDNNEDEGAQ